VKPMDDRVVFLAGAAEGLGREVARELAKAGERLALFDVAPAFAFLADIDADFATGQRFNAFRMSEAMRSVVA
jgi:NADP-dependent 3-hydroxy acid dehydrogenase YdfG